MKSLILVTALVSAFSFVGCKKEDAAGPASAGVWSDKAAAGKPIFATLSTSKGDITVELFSKDAPVTVKNFVGLASGEREWRHPGTGEVKKGAPLYNGLTFHRVIQGFMIQGGDPLGTGTGGPGYSFQDEFGSGRRFDKVGLLAMANAGPNTNGSQFFITTSMPQHLTGKHTIFGQVVKGYEVVEAISQVATGAMSRPVEPVVIKSVTLADAP